MTISKIIEKLTSKQIDLSNNSIDMELLSIAKLDLMLSHMSDTQFLVDLQRQDYDYSLDMWTLGCIFDGMV